MIGKHGMSTVQWAHAHIVKVVDGDTVDVSLYANDATLGPVFRVRLAGIDAPEITWVAPSARTDAWRHQNAPGVWSRAALMNIVSERDVLVKPTKAWCDKYGRVIARIRVGMVDVSQAMIEKGHAKPWKPTAKRLLDEIRAQQTTDTANVLNGLMGEVALRLKPEGAAPTR